MQYTLMNLLGSEHILVNINAKDAQDVITQLTKTLVETGHASTEFAQDAWTREQTFPTGLPTQPLAVAIPHADPHHVHRSAVCIGVLNAPVQFAEMGTDGSTFLDVRLVFLLAIKEQEKQVEMIQQLMTVIQNGDLLVALAGSTEPSQALALIQASLTQKGTDGNN